MEDLKARLEKLLLEAEDCELIAKLSNDPKKRSFFAKLSVEMRGLARDVEGQINKVTEKQA
jgi:hypothetical protein